MLIVTSPAWAGEWETMSESKRTDKIRKVLTVTFLMAFLLCKKPTFVIKSQLVQYVISNNGTKARGKK
jgi:hypothetical protein